LRLPIQDVYRFDDRRIYAGRIETGRLSIGDRLLFLPANKTSTIKTIERWSAPLATSATAGESVGITLQEQVFIGRGAIAVHEKDFPCELSRFKARIFWLGKKPFVKGRNYKLKLATQELECRIETVDRLINSSSLDTISRDPKDTFVGAHEVADLTLHTLKPLVFDVHEEVPAMGRFVIVDEFDIAGGGVILPDGYPRRTHDAGARSENIYWNQSKITSAQREARHGHPGCVVWLTGLSGAGKSTIATELERELFSLGKFAYVLDGDNIRHGLGSDLGFSPKDRTENIRRIGEVAKLFADAGAICITAFISPYRSDREMVRKIMPAKRFIEVFVNAPLSVCEQRDPKGLYAKARANEIKEFTGISAPYEEPLQPELELQTDQLSIADAVSRIIQHIESVFGRTRPDEGGVR
jgi:bifunctional enzyme CysN/CysC